MSVMTPYRSGLSAGRDGFAQLLHAEWTKFHTVRGWIIGLVIGLVAMAGLGLFTAGSASSSCQASGGPVRSGAACGLGFALGPAGQPVSDSFYFVRQPLTENGTITVRLTSMTGLLPPSTPPANQSSNAPLDTRPGVEPWAKAGIIIKSSLTDGSPYAAMMVAADHGVRMQWNYTGDTPGLPGAVGPENPRWLRLTRSGDVITGYDSADGTHWTEVGAVTLSGLPRVVQAGLFAASPVDLQSQYCSGYCNGPGGPTQATGVFDHVSAPSRVWTGGYVGAAYASGVGSYHPAGGGLSVTGSGDIAPIPVGHGGGADPAITVSEYLLGTFAGLIALGVVAALFITAEYRRSLIRVTFAASPRRGRVLAAKAVVVAAVSFVVGAVAAAFAVLVGTAITHARGYYAAPVSTATEVKVIIGTGLFAAVAAAGALAVGAITRRGAAAVTIVIVALAVPVFLAISRAVPGGAGDWLLRVTPAAGISLQQAYPQYQQVASTVYSPLNGYYPLSWWAGLLVLCAWAAVALGVAAYLLRRRDA
ncbi:MAG: ABC transporter permease subunit [Trebonia sp.]|uniref:ABC transporter permease subunit n=1 Tax=Trebonia sp. TaxID=2767075 RepID=UPI003C8AA72A